MTVLKLFSLLAITFISMNLHAQAKVFPLLCETKAFCAVIKKAKMNSNNEVICLGDNGSTFDCTQLAKDYGKAILGKSVLVKMNYVDACHVPGACGHKSCTLFQKYAELDVNCSSTHY